ncbi:hypothetical protein B0H13DRAFT_2474159 [Mycena leptocephala]|nr:hypothetical protein B0H13DRAFT_2474159 [Mycena leptocephala]
MANPDLAYTLPHRDSPLRRCRECAFQYPGTAHFWDIQLNLCRVCAFNFNHLDNPIVPPPPGSHPNHTARLTRYCTGCQRQVNNNMREWDANTDRCTVCAHDYAEQQGHRRAFAVAQEVPRIVIPRRQKCTLCEERFYQDREGHTRCRSCRKREKCSRCGKIKKRNDFRKPSDTAGNSRAADQLYKTCNPCRGAATTRAERLRWRQKLEVFSMQSRREEISVLGQLPQPAAAERDQESQGDGSIPDEEDEGVQAGPVDYNAIFGDGSDLAG